MQGREVPLARGSRYHTLGPGGNQTGARRHQKQGILSPAQLLDSSNCSNFSTHPLLLSIQLICPAQPPNKIQISWKVINVSYLNSACVSPASLLKVEVLLSPLVMVVREERLWENLYSLLLLPNSVLWRTILLFRLPRVLTVAWDVGPLVKSRSLLLLLLSSLAVGSLWAQKGRSETVLLRARVYPA